MKTQFYNYEKLMECINNNCILIDTFYSGVQDYWKYFYEYLSHITNDKISETYFVGDYEYGIFDQTILVKNSESEYICLVNFSLAETQVDPEVMVSKFENILLIRHDMKLTAINCATRNFQTFSDTPEFKS